MKVKLPLTLFAVLAFHGAVAQKWTYLTDTGGLSRGIAAFMTSAINPVSDELFVAFRDYYNGTAKMFQFHEGEWQLVGQKDLSDGFATCTKMLFNPQGEPYVAYGDHSHGYGNTVMKFDGTNWAAVGQKGFSEDAASYQSIAMDSKGIPYVAFRDKAHGYKASVMRFNGVEWEYVGGPAISTQAPYPDGASHLNIAIDHMDVPYIYYSDNFYDYRSTVQKFNGTNWEYVGEPGFAGFNAQYTKALVFDTKNRPLIVCSVDGRVTVMRFEGDEWKPVGKPSFSQGGAEYVALAIDDNDMPYVAFQDYGVTRRLSVMKYNGIDWYYLGEQGFSHSSVQHISIDIDKKGTVYVAFADNSVSPWRTSVVKFEQPNTTVIEERPTKELLTIYPNPSGSIFTIEGSDIRSLAVRDIAGRIVYSRQGFSGGTLDLSTVPTGVYMLEIQIGNTVENRKLVVE